MSVRLTKKSVVRAPDLVGEHAVLRAAMVRADDAHAADEHRHFRRSQTQKLGPIEQQLFRLVTA
jgi:hypothetical protein